MLVPSVPKPIELSPLGWMSTYDSALELQRAACVGPDAVTVTEPVCMAPPKSWATDESGSETGCRSTNDAAVPDQIAACSVNSGVAAPA